MALGGNRTKNRKKKESRNDSNSNMVTNQTVRPFNFGGSYKQASNRGKGGLSATGGAVFP